MRQAEYDAVMAPSELSHECKLIYSYLRRWIDYESCKVGVKRGISYQSIRENLEYLPKVRSSEVKRLYSRDQVKRYLQRLIDLGFIIPMHNRANIREAMVFLLPLAGSESDRVFSPRHNRATCTAPHETLGSARAEGVDSAITAPHEPRHTSVSLCSSSSLNINNNIYSAERNEPVQMTPYWQPADDVVDQVLLAWPMTKDYFDGLVFKFRRYWLDKGEARQSFDVVFLDYCERKKIFREQDEVSAMSVAGADLKLIRGGKDKNVEA